jgi:hypothetical protein
MVSFEDIMGPSGYVQQTVNVGSTMIPGGNLLFGSQATQNQGNLLGAFGSSASSLFGSATGAVGGLLGSPVVLIGGAVVLLILLK